jgi:hypothetical protein
MEVCAEYLNWKLRISSKKEERRQPRLKEGKKLRCKSGNIIKLFTNELLFHA